MTIFDVPALKAANLARWQAMTVPVSFRPIITNVALRLINPGAKASYQTVETATKVPWFVTAVIHEREASQSWRANLAQGDPWDKVSVHVPKGCGPFGCWEDAAIDALKRRPPYVAVWNDWTPGGTLTILEEYNGLGYAMRGYPSPYIWASTDQYIRGKFVSDHHFDPDAIDHQLGCAALIKQMMGIDPSIKFAETIA
jgi:lysozyme family protein